MLPIAVKRLLKRSNLLVNANHFLYKWSGGVRTNYEIVERLAAFSPNSAGSLQARGAMALEAAQQTFPLLSSLIITTSAAPLAPRPITGIYPETRTAKDTAELNDLFERHGSDKSSSHDYHLLYAPILVDRL